MGRLAELLRGIEIPEEAHALVAEAETAIADRFKDASYIEELESQVKDLRTKLGLPDSSQGLKFDAATGAHIDPASGLHYCTKCFVADKRSPMKDDPHGWRCMVCSKFYSDPRRPYPNIAQGPSDWMA